MDDLTEALVLRLLRVVSCCISHLVIEGASILRILPELNDATLFFRWTDTSAHSRGRSWRLEEEEYDFHVFGLGSVENSFISQ